MKEAILEAFDLKRKGYYKQAIEVYYKLLSQDNNNIEILTELADLYFQLENYERAVHYAEKVLEINSEHIGSLNILKNVYVRENEQNKARDIACKIYKISPAPDNLDELLKILLKQKNYEEIISLTENTEDTQCLYRKSIALLESGRKSEAVELIKILQTKPDFYIDEYENILELTGKVYLEQNKISEAKEVFEKLEDNNTQTAEGLNYVGLNKLDELKIDEAIEYFAKAIMQDDKNAQYHYNMGQAYFLNGWFDEAKKCFNSAICINPMEEKYHYSLAYLFYKTGDFESAKAHINTEYLESKILLQIIESENGNLAAPKVELEKMLKENPDNETILYSLAKIYFKLDMFKQSKTIIEKIIKINPKFYDYHMFNVRLMLKLNMLEEAETEIKNLIESYPKYYYVYVLKAEVEIAKKDYDELFDTAQYLIELDINHYEGYYYNALALFEKEDVNFAVESLKKAISLDVCNADLYVKMSEFYQALGKYEDAFLYIKEASDIDKSAKNRELYIKLADIVRKNRT